MQLPDSEFSISLWFKTASVANSQTLLSKGVSDANEEYTIDLKGGDRIYWDYGNVGYVQTDPGVVAPNQWYHLVVLYNRSFSPYGKVYLNAIEQHIALSGGGSHIVTSGSSLYIGTQNAGKPYYGGRTSFNGLIDEVAIFNRALTASEILSIYTAGSAGKCKTGLTISGRVTDGSNNGISGVTMTLSGSQSRSATTDANGNYSLTNLVAGGNYTVTPSKSGYTFNPPSQTFNNLSSNQTANFAGTLIVTDLSIAKTDSPDPVSVNSSLTYTITVTNNGPNPATGAIMTDTLPVGVNFGSATPSQGSCTRSGGTVTCNLGTLNNAANAAVTIVVTPTSTGTITNTASVTSNEGDSNPSNNTASQDTTVLAPDLQVSSVNAPNQAFTDSTFDLSWTDINNGQARANGPWTDKVYLSTDNQLGNDIQLAEFPFSQSLDPGQSATRTQTISIPRSAVPADGQYFLIVLTDANNNVGEGSNENNNWRAVPITVSRTAFPDLVVEAIQAPDAAFFDQQITVRWTVKNTGNGSTNASEWRDRLFLSSDQTIGDDALQLDVLNASYLNAGESYVASADVRIPRGLFGTYYVIVKTDNDNTVTEDNEGNNTQAKAINLQVPPLPDLIVTNVQAPEEGFPGQPMLVNWSVKNQGTGNTPTNESVWFDGIYLAKDQNFTSARRIGSRKHEGGLAKDGSYTVNGFSVDIPKDISGDWFVFVVADDQNSVYEFTSENNNSNHDPRAIHILATPPDLIVSSIDVPKTGLAGRQISVNWNVQNQGASEAGPSWFDSVYFSTDATLDPKTDTPLATVYHGSPLSPGASYPTPASATVTLPSCISGTYYLFVLTDSRNQLFELNQDGTAESNNFSPAQAIQVASTPPDLQVTSVSNEKAGEAGKSVPMSWTVVNSGTGPTAEGSWVDNVYLSPSSTFNAGTALLAGSFTRNGNLAPNEPYTRTESVTIPNSARGIYYVFVLTDALDTVEECDKDNNNVGASPTTIDISNNQPPPPEPPDLTGIVLSAPGNAFAGQTITVQWTVNNAGPGALSNQAWNDTLYFSTDTTLDANDTNLATKLNSGPLAVGASYQAQAQATIPNVPAGTYYLIAQADSGKHIAEGQREDNNTGYIAISIAVPNVDLQITNVTVPGESFYGQEMAVSWTVTNAGTMQTFASQWTDYVLLSRDQILDPTDKIIGYKAHTEKLDGGGSYTASANATVPAGLSGPYYVFIQTDYHNQVIEADESNNVRRSDAFLLQLPPPVDLTVTAIEAPAPGSPGEPSTIRWMVQNTGNNTAISRWTDAVYLSTDLAWDIGDALIDRVAHAGPLAAGQTYTSELTANLPAVNPGQYYVIVRTDVRNNVRESDETNNVRTSTGTMTVDVVELQLGVPYGSTLRTGQERYHKVNVPGNETLLYILDAQRNDSSTELFAQFGLMPSRSAFDYFFSRPNEADQEVVVPNTQAGTYYDLARGAYVPPDAGDMPFTIKAEVVPFSIRSVSPNRIGDNGQVTITLKGAKFQEGATVQLVGNGTTLTAAKVMVLDSATVKARFFLTNAKHGIYDVVLTNPSGATVSNGQAVTIETATELLADVNVNGDLNPRVGRRFTTDGIVQNIGNIDLPVVQVGVSFTGNVKMGWSRPIDARPFRSLCSPELRPCDWESDSITARFTGEATADGFYIRDLAPGESVTFANYVTQFSAGPFRTSVVARAMTVDAHVTELQELTEQLRQNIISNHQELPAPLINYLNSAQDWWTYFREAYQTFGLLNLNEGLNVRNAKINTKSATYAKAAANQEVCEAVCIPARLTRCVAGIVGGLTFCASNPLIISNPYLTLGCALLVPVGGLWCTLTSIQQCREDCREISRCGVLGWAKHEIGISEGCGEATVPRDPNEKYGLDGFGPQGFIPAQQALPYTIDFENIPTASAAAQRVQILDKLDPNLDWRTFRLKEIGFGNYRITVPENRAFFQTRIQLGADLGNLLADMSARLDITTGQVTWTLTAIDPKTGEQPTSASLGLLPPNDDTGRGQGYVTYTIQPKTTAPTGAQIANNATIIFDTEEPIITNTVTNTLDAGLPTSAVAPLPATSEQTFTISWSGDDPAGGAGLQSYDIFVAENDGPYQPFLSGTTETSAQFTGQPGTTYRFYSIARDNAGNVEAPPATPDATTTVKSLGYEADVAPRPNGSNTGLLTLADYAQVGRFFANLDTPGAGVDNSEFQRADCAPKSSKGDGRITLADYAQAGRYFANLDQVVPVGGPVAPILQTTLTAQTTLATILASVETQAAALTSVTAAREVRVASTSATAGTQVSVPILLEAQGDEHAISFSLNFDPAVLSNPQAIPGSDATGAQMTVNANQAAQGRFGVALILPGEQTFAAGTRQVVLISFTVAQAAAGNTPLSFGDQPIPRDIINNALESLPATYTAGAVTITPACPIISGISVTSGAVGSTVTITGTNLSGVTAVNFANNISAAYIINSPTQITAVVPQGATSGAITLSKSGCADVQTSSFTVIGGGAVLLISEMRLRGPNGALDEFIELYNNTDSALTISTIDNSSGWAVVASDGVTRFIVPNGTVIPARGHYLGVNNSTAGYSLTNYPAGHDAQGNATTATGDATWNLDIPDNAGLALFATSSAVNFTSAYRLDAVGFAGNPALYLEGTPLSNIGTSNSEYSLVRKTIVQAGVPRTGRPQDTDINADDFVLVSTTAALFGNVTSILGAPGPENLSSPIQRNAQIRATLLDPMAGTPNPPNRQRLSTCGIPEAPPCPADPNTAPDGYLSIRRTYTNRTGGPITRLRFRIVDITGAPAQPGIADLRLLVSFRECGVRRKEYRVMSFHGLPT